MLQLVVAATTEPVALAEMKLHLRETSDARNTLIATYITAAREVVELQSCYALAEATYDWTPEGGYCERLPICPGEVSSEPDELPIRFATRPGPPPAALKVAVMLLAADMLANPKADAQKLLSESPLLSRLIFPYRRVLP